MKTVDHVLIAQPEWPFDDLSTFLEETGQLWSGDGAILLDENLVDRMEIAVGCQIWAPAERPIGTASRVIRRSPERFRYEGIRLLLYAPEKQWGVPDNYAFALDEHPHPGRNYLLPEQYEELARVISGHSDD